MTAEEVENILGARPTKTITLEPSDWVAFWSGDGGMVIVSFHAENGRAAEVINTGLHPVSFVERLQWDYPWLFDWLRKKKGIGEMKDRERGQLATFTTPDLNAQSGDFNVIVNWGDGQSQPDIATGSAGSFTISGDHTYTGVGSYTITVTITNATGATQSGTATIPATVSDAAITLTGGLSDAAVDNQSTTVNLATFTDGNPYYTASDFSVTVNWGDGSSASTISVGPAQYGIYQVAGTHTYTANGTYTASVTVTATGGAFASTTSTVTVTSSPPMPTISLVAENIMATAGVTDAGVVLGIFTDSNASDTSSMFCGSYDEGNGATPITVTITGSNGLFTVTGSPTYSSIGVYSATLKIFAGTNVIGTEVEQVGVGQAAWGGGALSGPAIVPGNSQYPYWISAAAANGGFNPQLTVTITDGAGHSIPATTVSYDYFTWTPLLEQGFKMTFKNVPAVVSLSYTVCNAAGVRSQPWTLTVIIVEVDVTTGEFVTSTQQDGAVLNRGTLMQIVNSNQLFGGAPTLSWNAGVTLTAPNSNPDAVTAIQVGFFQHVTYAQWAAVYNFSLALQTAATPMLNNQSLVGQTFLDVADGQAGPWYDSTSLGTPVGGPVDCIYLEAKDTPVASCPMRPQQAANGSNLLLFIKQQNFALDVAATIAASPSPYWAEAGVSWVNTLSASPAAGNTVTFAAADCVTGPTGGWMEGTQPDPEIITAVTGNQVLQNCTWAYQQVRR